MVTLICGPMYSGKSTSLFQRMERLLYAGKKILLIRPKKDNRGYFTHSEGIDLNAVEEKFKENLDTCNTEEISLAEAMAIQKGKWDAVFVDEYFMIPGAHNLCHLTDIDIYYGGLLASSECELFDETIKILPYCDKIKKLNAVCMDCKSENASYSYANFKKTSAVDVGDTKYLCLCQKCYFKRIGEKAAF